MSGGLGAGGLSAGGGLGGVGAGSFAGGNASFSMGANGRGMVNPGNVGPVANAQVPVSGAGGGMGGMPMRGKNGSREDEDGEPTDDMFLDEDRDVWADSVTAPPGTIQ